MDLCEVWTRSRIHISLMRIESCGRVTVQQTESESEEVARQSETRSHSLSNVRPFPSVLGPEHQGCAEASFDRFMFQRAARSRVFGLQTRKRVGSLRSAPLVRVCL